MPTKLEKFQEMMSRATKPVLNNPDGSRSSELTQTIQLHNGRFINVPTIDPARGQSITTDEGVKLEYGRSGGNPETFGSLEDAVRAAKIRSRSGGRDR